MRKLLFIIAVLLSFGVQAQTFTPIHNYQAPDGLDVAKFFGIPYGSTPTLNGVNRPGGHPLFYNTTDSSLYLYSGNQWIRVGGGNGNKDTVKVGYGLNVIWDSTGQQLLYADHEDGLVNGGVVTKGIADWDLDVTDAYFYKNHRPYSTNSSTVTIDTADATYDRIDVIAVDTTGSVVVITGTPSANPIKPQVNPSSQLALTEIKVSAGSTFAPVITKIIYDQGTEWDTATSGTISAFFNNEDNPYNGSKDIFVQTYENGGALEFTDSEPDTATSNMVLKYFLYLNDEFTNSFQVQFFDDSDPVSNSLSFNSGFGLNPNNVNVYQNISIPLTSFNFSSNYFNKVKITMAGEDISGAAGYYLDYIQLQKGLSQTGSGSCPLCIVDIHVTADSMYQVSIRQNGDTASVINWTGGGGSGGGIESIVAGDNITVDDTDPSNPVVNAVLNGINTASNGLTKVGNDVQLGGTMKSGNTLILGQSDTTSALFFINIKSVTFQTKSSSHEDIAGSYLSALSSVGGTSSMLTQYENEGNNSGSYIQTNLNNSSFRSYSGFEPYSLIVNLGSSLITFPDGVYVISNTGRGIPDSGTVVTSKFNVLVDSSDIPNADNIAYFDSDNNLKRGHLDVGGGGSTTFEQSLQNQGETAFTTDNTVDFGGKDFVMYNGNSFISAMAGFDIGAINFANPAISSGVGAVYINDSTINVSLTANKNGSSSGITVNQNSIMITGTDTLPTPPPYIAGFDGDTLKKVAYIANLDSTVTLSSGTITVSDTRVKTGARIFVSCNAPSGTQGFLSAKTSDIVDGTSFIINSSSAADNSTVNYTIINP